MSKTSIISVKRYTHIQERYHSSKGTVLYWTLLVCIFLSVPAFAQQAVTYSYDSAGNRIERSWTRGAGYSGQKQESLNPITILPTTDTLSPKHKTINVSLDLNNLPLTLSEDEKAWLNEEFSRSQIEEELSWWKSQDGKQITNRTSSDYSVGAIELQDGISPSGARTYSIPIPTAAGFNLVPTVSLGYNSQAAEGWAGYGWDIQGISCIRLINKNEYYHEEIKAADVTASDPVFALDGIPLVTNNNAETSSAYPLETARGHILAAPEYNSYNKVCRFTVLYPNGIRAVYGRSHSYNYNLVFYNLSEMQDIDGNKITFTYTLDTTAGHDIISTIRYGYDNSGTYSGEISFNYDTWTNCPIRYFAGKEIRFPKRLAIIESRTEGDVLARYDLSYTMAGPLWLLNHIDCSSDNLNLPPLEFAYSTVPASQNLKKDTHSITLNQSFFPPDSANVYKRGKFITNDYRDGIVIYPAFLPYTALQGGYGSNFPSTQKIIFVPRLESSNVVDSEHLICEYGFQTIEAVDIDGDGKDELVKVNMIGRVFGNTKYKITVYRISEDGIPVPDSPFDIQLEGVTVYHGHPAHRIFRWGDFNGDGKVELLAVAYDKNYPGNDTQPCYTALIDINNQSILSNDVLFNGFTPNKNNCLIVSDIDNDGRTELCYADTDGFKIFRLQGSGHFALEKTLPSPTSSILLDNYTRPCYFADFNGDGYLDIARTPASNTSSIWTVYYYNGSSFTNRTMSIAQPSSYTNAMFMDVNYDGMADLVTIKEVSDTSATLGTYINKNGYSFGAYQLSPSDITDARGIVPVNLSAYNRPSAFMKFDGLTVYNYSYTGITASSRHITRVKDSYGKIHSNGYAYLPSRASTWRDNSFTVNTTQGYKFYTLPIYVLSVENHYMSESLAKSYASMTYEYYNGVLHNRGLGFCGFSKIRTKEMYSPATFAVKDVSDVYYLPEKMGMVGQVVRKKGTLAQDPAYYTQTNTWDNHSTTYGKLSPRLTGSVETDAVTGITTRSNYIYDSWDYPTEARISRNISGSITQYERHTRVYQHSNLPSRYVLGTITGKSVTQDRDGDTEYQWKNKTVTMLDSLFHPVSQKQYKGKVYCPSANPYYEYSDYTLLVGETRWTYDSYGNVISEKYAPYDATEFIGHTYTYDSKGRNLLTDTDALGHTTTYANYNKFGKPERVVDYRGRSTYYSYDAWGNITTVRHINESVESISRVWGGEGVYTVTKTEADGGPVTIFHYDGLEREIRTGVKRFDGQWQYTDTEYDRFGRVNKKSLPFRGTAPAYWNTYTYDNYDRPVKILEPSGKETTWSYSGTSVTTIKDGIISISTKDASGDVICVQDAGGTITYNLRDDAQPSKITAPGNVETTFAYDNYGRRTSIVDPSAGTRSEAYVWNPDGSHQQTHTGPNGSITTAWDKYGRTVSVERPGEFNTTYTYNTYGLLSNEQSTNGTAIEYTYDNYDRISTVKETVPGGRWLKKTCTYGNWNNLSSVKYTTQDGDITTETYGYSNGNNTGISITGGTTVWSLVSENDLGIPTEITTGSISRQYGFTDFGLPTYRKMAGGSLQNYTYQFNANNGNLTSRTDVINNKTESFKYDALNRLDTLGTRVVNYANNGNILSLTSVGSMSYGNTDAPYQVTSLAPVYSGLVPSRTQEITYNSLDRPSVLEEGSKTATFTYNAAGDRVKMYVTNGVTQELTRYYIGSQYEYDTTSSGTTERLYLGGDAYSAPMVLQRVNSGNWTAYNIGRDYLGSITHIASASGTLVAEYSYDPWGRQRSPSTLGIYTPGGEPELFLGRGFTGHEHLTWFGLINMNARLYDPLVGRFLSPDPYVQAPDFTQNFNRYSYALNNPLKYTDTDGEFLIPLLFGIGNLVAHNMRGEDLGNGNWAKYLFSGMTAGLILDVVTPLLISGMAANAGRPDLVGLASRVGVGYMSVMTILNTLSTFAGIIGGAINHQGEGVANAMKILLGNFYLDENKSFFGEVWEGISRHTWEYPQQAAGYFWSSMRNCWADRVDYLGGGTFVTNEESNGSGISFGSFLNINDTGKISGDFDNYVAHHPLYMHEYGHYIDSQRFGPTYLPVVGSLSLISAMSNKKIGGNWAHNYYWTETRANNNASSYFGRNYGVDWINDIYNGSTYVKLFPL